MRTVEEIKAEYADCLNCKRGFDCLSISSDCPKPSNIEHYHFEYLRTVTASIPFARLSEICAAERDGRCVVLPCKVGDTVYMNSGCLFYHDNAKYTACEVVNFRKGKAGALKMYLRPLTEDAMNTRYHKIVTVAAIGITVFLTRAEAEAAKGGA